MEMKFIENQKARKRAYEKRRNSLLKKAKELSILCDINIFVIIFELDKQKPEIWPANADEATQFINRFKQPPVRGDGKNPCDSFASKKKKIGEKFPISDDKSMINLLSENQLQKLTHKLDDKIAAVMNAIKSKQLLSEGPSPKMSTFDDFQGIGFLNKGKGKEVDIYRGSIPIQQDQSFQMLYHTPNSMGSPMMMMQNGISYPQFDSSSSSSNSPYAPLPIDYVNPSWMQPAYMDANPFYDPTIYHIPPGIYYP